MRTLAACTVVASLLVASPRPASAQPSPPSLTSFEVRRVERFLDQRVACRGCHQIAGRGGWIGPSLDGVRERAGYDQILRMIRDPAREVPGTLMPRQRIAQRESERLAAYLVSLPPLPDARPAVDPEAAAAIPAGRENDGAALYARHCAACHGPTGHGDGWNAGDLPVVPAVHADADAMSKRPDDSLYDGIAAGAFVLDGSNLMPAFGEMLDPEQIDALVAYIRSLCGCEQPSWAGSGR